MSEIDKQSKIILKNGEILCSLPITAHTSKIRVKRNGEPLATRQKNLLDSDLIEWQISYYKPNTNKELFEIGLMLKIAYENGIISREELKNIKEYVKKVDKTFFESYSFRVEKLEENFYDFMVMLREFPFLRKFFSDGCSLEIEIKHKQKAVGFQPMLYIFIPLKNVVSENENNLIGRKARPKERVIWKPNKIHIIETIKAFAIASKTHLNDIKEILNRIES
ncbi:MAG: R.Pab1 family restriction endonuclease [Candidatus Aenigmatarchaeota archaeon]